MNAMLHGSLAGLLCCFCLDPGPTCSASCRLACRFCLAFVCTADHDIWDGYGSYEPRTQGCPVFQVRSCAASSTGSACCCRLLHGCPGWHAQLHALHKT